VGKKALRLAGPSERRRIRRLLIIDWLYSLQSEPLTLETPVVIRDLSLGGFSIEGRVQIPTGEEHAFRFTDEERSSFVTSAISVYSAPVSEANEQLYLTGLKFQPSSCLDNPNPVEVLLDKIHKALLL